MADRSFTVLSEIMVLVDSVLAWLHLAVQEIRGHFLYVFSNGMPPQTHTRPMIRPDGSKYSPSVLITGSSEGIGLATAIQLALKGYNVFASVKSQSELIKVMEAVYQARLDGEAEFLGAVHPVVMDVLFGDSIHSCVEQISSELEGKPDKALVGVINCNIGYHTVSPMEMTSDDDVRQAFDLDFWPCLAVVRGFLPLIKQSQGRFINIGGYGGYNHPSMCVPYAAAKGAIEGMSRAWQAELMPFGVGMACVRTGPAWTAGCGPGIVNAWEHYHDRITDGDVGLDGGGEVPKALIPMSEEQEKVYRPMLDRWHKLEMTGAEGNAQHAHTVANIIHTAMTDRFLSPMYEVGKAAPLW